MRLTRRGMLVLGSSPTPVRAQLCTDRRAQRSLQLHFGHGHYVELSEWINGKGGIVHREVVRSEKWSDLVLRAAARSGSVEIIRRTWVATSAAPTDLLVAARAGARIGCFSLAREKGWWMPEDADTRRHLSIRPHAKPGTIEPEDVIHWTKPVAPASAHSLHESIEDALEHIVRCASPESARAMWESAIRTEKLSVAALQKVKWRSRAASRLAREVSDLSDSGLETIFLIRLAALSVAILQQQILAGHPVDFLIGRSLVVQVDGYEFHRTAADRGRDVLHDAELRLRGYTVLRFTYAQVLHDWLTVERAIVRAVSAKLHLVNVR